MKETTKFTTVSEYIASFPPGTRAMLNQVRRTIKRAAPEAEEMISYNMPGYKLNGPLAYFAGYSKHIGFYPTPSGIKSFAKELSKYKGAKGSVQFPLDQPLPLDLIEKMVKHRAKEMEKKSRKINSK
jgi:uncharacterized protein YdhG (YjbR/CyaY superfamily)